MTIRDCLLNTSCNSLRIGGVNLLVEDCRFVGPGIYPHRLSIPHGKDDKTPLSAGRHNTLFAFNYFCSKTYPPSSPACNWLIRRCTFENIDQFLCYFANDDANLHSGAPLIDIRMEDLEITGLLPPCDIKADPDHPLRIHQDHVSVRFRDGVPCEGRLFGSGCENVWITDC